jgi:hypothetical protein
LEIQKKMLLKAVHKALVQKRCFEQWDTLFKNQDLQTIDQLVDLLLQVFHTMDKILFEGAIFQCLHDHNVPLQVKKSHKGPAGLTTYHPHHGMQVFLNANAWVNAFPAMVGGTLCNSAEICLTQVFAHELIHVLLFTIYIELGMSQEDIESLPTAFDTHHNVLFVRWLKQFFNQDTIDNSLLLQSPDSAAMPLTFQKTVQEIESQCLATRKSQNLRVWYHGAWKPASFVAASRPHHSVVRTHTQQRRTTQLVVPNGLLTC